MTEAQQEWARCRGWLQTAVERSGFYTIEFVEGEIEAGRMAFWPSENGAVLTRFVEYPKGRALNLFAIAGQKNASLGEILEVLQPRIDAYAKATECRWIIGNGRPGWKKISAQSGYRQRWLVLTKEIA